MKKFIITVFVLVVVLGLFWIFYPKMENDNVTVKGSADPMNATYIVEGKSIKLVNGKAESEIEGGSSKLVTTIFGNPSYGDLNEDGTKDAVAFLTQTGGGSGTFYYAVIALNKDEAFNGLSAVFLGDRISPQSILVRDDVAMVNFAERKQGEPMSTPPSVGVTKYLVVDKDSVKEFNLLNKGEQLFAGNLVMASETRIFTPCGGTAHWVIGSSPAYAELMKAYTNNKPTTTPYASVYAVVSGIIVDAPTDGFGKDYNYGIDVKSLLKVVPFATCPKV